jgi:hypothetical protein
MGLVLKLGHKSNTSNMRTQLTMTVIQFVNGKKTNVSNIHYSNKRLLIFRHRSLLLAII